MTISHNNLISITTPSPHCAIIKIAISIVLLALSNTTNATCTFAVGNTATLNINVPASLAVPRNAPNGTVIYTSSFSAVPFQVSITCTGDSLGIVNSIGNQPPPGQNTFPIGTTGLSWRWLYNPRAPEGEGAFGTYTQSWTSGFGGTTHAFQLIKTGPITGNASVPSGIVGQWRLGALNALEMRLSNQINISQTSCTTPDVRVNLGNHTTTDLNAIDKFTASTDFDIPLNSCPSGIRTIRYQVDAVTRVLDADRAIAALNSSSTAQGGIGVQLLDRSNNAHKFATSNTLAGATAAGGNFRIPLRARYYRTGPVISSGTAGTSMTFTIFYE